MSELSFSGVLLSLRGSCGVALPERSGSVVAVSAHDGRAWLHGTEGFLLLSHSAQLRGPSDTHDFPRGFLCLVGFKSDLVQVAKLVQGRWIEWDRDMEGSLGGKRGGKFTGAKARSTGLCIPLLIVFLLTLGRSKR